MMVALFHSLATSQCSYITPLHPVCTLLKPQSTIMCYSAVPGIFYHVSSSFIIIEGTSKKQKRIVLTIKEKTDICQIELSMVKTGTS
jgi:hypothetical protein